MANKKALSMLKAGREKWNRWNKEKLKEFTNSFNYERILRPGYSPYTRPVDLSGANLHGMSLAGFDLQFVNLTNADLGSADLTRANLLGAVLRNTTAVDALLDRVNLSQAACEGADFSKSLLLFARCHMTDFRRASLKDADLGRADFSECKMDGADLSGAKCGYNVWANTDLRGVRGLATTRHTGASTLGLDTVLASAGEIPEVFLQGCGLPDSVIAYVASIARSRNPIELYSCFISYSSRDGEFCERLHNNLQAVGVRCWFAPEDLKIGDRFRDQIESAIRIHDKLLLVLSENSVQSDWVRSEVEGAFERETREGKQVLFPVRLDDAVIDTPKAWAADIRRQRHIGDFSGWKDDDSYKRAFDRLLRDLRAVPNA